MTDKKNIRILGLSIEQIEMLSGFYELCTGISATKIESINNPDGINEWTKEIDRHVRLGLWAKEHGIPALLEVSKIKNYSMPYNYNGQIAEKSLSKLPKEEK